MSTPTDPRKQQSHAQQGVAALSEADWALLDELRASARADAADAKAEAVPATHALAPDTATLRAAIADTYTAEELGGSAPATLLHYSDRVLIGGRRRLRLQPQARAQVLAAAQANADTRALYHQLLGAATAQDQRDFAAVGRDPARCADAWLRSLLEGRHGDLDRAPSTELHGALQAATDLQFVRLDHAIPSVEDVRDRLEIAELLEPMRLLTGCSGGWDGRPASDRFVGRDKELTELRSYVDALQAQSWMESARRAITKLQKRVEHSLLRRRNPGVLMLQGRGGMGKSTLLSKFVLDHVRSLTPPVPLIYLDFDRAGLQSCSRRQLLLESVRQARLQFPRELVNKYELPALEAQIGQALLRGDGGDEREWWQRLRGALSAGAGRDGTVLLVLDTMEAVQAIPDALDRVIGFVDAFGTDFSQLRIVAAGRAEVPELVAASRQREQGRTLTLAPLPVKEARAMAERLGRDLLGADWNSKWSAGIAGAADEDNARREPLSVRIAVELLRAQPEEGRETLAQEIAQRSAGDIEGFVGALYRRRVLSHVRDPQAQKLAWPGLVLRRIDPTLVRELLAPLCGLDLDNLDRTYEALAREVWIVARDGDGLRHLADLRSRTLPLMRRNDADLFERVNRAAIEYFGARRDEDLRAHAEWLYHRLLAGEASRAVERDWREDVASLLAGADEDFEPGSDAAQFLLARTARRALSADKVLRLSPRRALEHVARRWPDLATLDEEKLVPLLARLNLDDAELAELPRELRNVHFALRVKTGRWMRVSDFDNDSQEWLTAAYEANLYLLGRSLSAAHSADWLNRRSSGPPLGAAALLNHSTKLCQAILALVADDNSEECAGLDLQLGMSLRILQETAGRDPNRLPLALRNLLRPTAARSHDALVPALRLLAADAAEQPPEERSYNAEEVRALLDSSVSVSLHHALDRNVPYFIQFVNPTYAGMPLRLSDPAATEALDAHLLQLLDKAAAGSATARDIAALRRYAAARHPDCLVPIAYAAARACRSRVPAAVHEHIDLYALENRDRWLPSSLFSKRPRVDDVMTALRLADEAGDLLGLAEVFARQAEDPVAGQDLDHLVYCLRLRRVMPLSREIDATVAIGTPTAGSVSGGNEAEPA